MKEFRVEFVLSNNGKLADEALLNDLVKQVMLIRENFPGNFTSFNMSEETVEENVHIETVCPLCDGVIPQLRYRMAKEGEPT